MDHVPTQFVPPNKEELEKKHMASHRSEHFTLQKNTFRYDFSYASAAGGGNFETTDTAAMSAEIKTEVKTEPEVKSAIKEEEDGQPASIPDQAKVVQGWQDSVFIPFEFDVAKSVKVLTDIGLQYEISIEHDTENNVLMIGSDSQESLSDGRDAINRLFYNSERAIKSKTRERFAKADRPGLWGQPRAELSHRKSGQE